MKVRSKLVTGVAGTMLALSAVLVGILGNATEAKADVQWYWHAVFSQCEDPCSRYIEGWCWCVHGDPIIVG